MGGVKDSDTDSKNAGTKLHNELATYLSTGDASMLSALAARGLSNLPPPRNPATGQLDILVEQSIGGPKHPFVTADGVPLVGKIDYLHDRGINYGGSDIENVNDPPGTVEVGDHKWKRDGAKLEYFLEPNELIKTIQMSGYGVFVAKAFPGHSHIRLSHNYYPLTRGVPRKVTKLHVIDDCLRAWEYVDALGRVVKDVAKERTWDHVPGNRHSCNKYGGCEFRETCSTYKQDSLAMLFGETATSELKQDLQMGLILPPSLQAQQPAFVAPPVPQAPSVDLRLQLEQQEQAQRAAAAQTMVGVLPGFLDACNVISQSGKGFPAMGGAAAQMYAACGGQSIAPGTTFAGTLDLAKVTLTDPTHLLLLANEIKAEQEKTRNAQPTAPMLPQMQHVQHNTVASILPPDAPASNPALAAKPIEGYSMPGLQMLPPAQAAPLLPPNTFVAAPADTGKRHRRTKAEMEAARNQVSPSSAPSPQVGTVAPPSSQPAIAVGADDGFFEVFIDCVPNGEYESLHPYIDGLNLALNQKFNTAPGALQDIRCVFDKNSPLAYGGWKGAINALVRELPPTAARYFLDTRGNEIALEVADAMRTVCEKAGGLYVRGIR